MKPPMAPPTETRTVYTVLDQTAAAHPKAVALQQPVGGGKYRAWTWSEYRDAVRQIAVGLRAIGIRKGDIVALQSETRAEFYLADLGLMTAGAVAAALYTSLPFADQVRTLRASDARVVFVENEKAMRSLQEAAGGSLSVQWILLTGEAKGWMTLEQIRAIGENRIAEFDPIRAETTGADHAVLYMTSGATGEPKMGLVTHYALVSNMDHAPLVLPLRPDDVTIAFLPSAHIAQRVVVELVPIRQGVCVWFSEGLSKLPNEIRTIRPTFFLAPPRVWERVYSSISAEIKKRPAAIRKLFYTGLGAGSEASRLRQSGKPVPALLGASLRFFDRLVFSKIRERLGGRLRIAASGAAPLGKDLAEFFAAIGMPLIEGYGLTEGGVVALNPLDRPKAGSIGKLLPNVEARLEDDGELMLKSPCLFTGYYKDPQATAAVLHDGWLATGDIAEVDPDGYWYITGRKKELIVSSNGKKIYPARIEVLFKREPSINQVLLIGDRLPYVTALFTVNGAPGETKSAVDRAVKDVNKQLASFEQIRKYRIVERDFSIDQGEVTPTMKIRRSRVLENFRSVVSEMYMGKDID
ncbi:MAG TPA: long-chain fatty acid--CoA ligase [Bryobacteraceae bacterium]|nr:long-chain fatty acid--CoA ligase [Bryobacteraceae bacterium]